MKAWRDTASELNSLTNKLQALKWSEGLVQACYDHISDIGPKGSTSHSGSNGSKAADRIYNYIGTTRTAENLAFSDLVTGEGVILQLLVDDGVENKGHRRNILDEAFTHVGVS